MNAKDFFTKLQRDPMNEGLFADWYRAEYPAFYYHALRVTSGNRQLAEDYCQDAIVAFIMGDGLAKVRDTVEARAYVRRAIVNRHIDTLRKLARETPLDADQVVAGDAQDPADAIIAAQLYDTLLNALSKENQTILTMLIAGESLSDIADVCGLSYSATGVRVHRIRRLISKLIDSH